MITENLSLNQFCTYKKISNQKQTGNSIITNRHCIKQKEAITVVVVVGSFS